MLWLLLQNFFSNPILGIILTIIMIPWYFGSFWVVGSWNAFYTMNLFFDVLFYPYYLVVEAYSVSEAMAMRPLYNSPTN